jgi:hypothetical protein
MVELSLRSHVFTLVATLLETPMLQFVCEVCGKRETLPHNWTLGFENEGKEGAGIHRTITLLGKWDDQRAGEWNAVHFCSESCRKSTFPNGMVAKPRRWQWN